MDVDGTLTDGGLYIGPNVEIAKRFHVKDGYAIHDLLPETCMKIVGLRGCPCDAADEVKQIADYITIRSGGNGAVREFVEKTICQMESE